MCHHFNDRITVTMQQLPERVIPAKAGIQFLRTQKLASQTQSFSLFHNEKFSAEQVLATLGLGTALQRCDVFLE